MADTPSAWQPIFGTLIAIAFSAWAGVVIWFGNAINDRLTDLQQTMESVEREMGDFKLSVSERVTRIETKVEQTHK